MYEEVESVNTQEVAEPVEETTQPVENVSEEVVEPQQEEETTSIR